MTALAAELVLLHPYKDIRTQGLRKETQGLRKKAQESCIAMREGAAEGRTYNWGEVVTR